MDFYLNIRNSSYKQRKHLKGYMSYFSYTKLFVSVFCNPWFQYWSCLCFIFWSAIKLLEENNGESQQQHLNAVLVNHARVLWWVVQNNYWIAFSNSLCQINLLEDVELWEISLSCCVAIFSLAHWVVTRMQWHVTKLWSHWPCFTMYAGSLCLCSWQVNWKIAIKVSYHVSVQMKNCNLLQGYLSWPTIKVTTKLCVTNLLFRPQHANKLFNWLIQTLTGHVF